MTIPGTLIIARHNESEWNEKGMWTGSRNVHLTPYGFSRSNEMGKLLEDTRIDNAFASMQVRSIETLSCMLDTLKLYKVPTAYEYALDERDYGDYTGKNKWEMEKIIGEDIFNHIRRDWEYPIPNGETLKMVYARVVPFYCKTVIPLLASGHNVLLVSHGNALRALMMFLESVPPEKAPEVKMLFDAVVLYQVDDEGKMVQKEVRTIETVVRA